MRLTSVKPPREEGVKPPRPAARSRAPAPLPPPPLGPPDMSALYWCPGEQGPSQIVISIN